MRTVNVYFKNFDPLQIELINHPVADKFINLVKNHYTNYPVVFRDNLKYNMTYFEQLAKEANSKLGWKWKTENITEPDTVVMHKDLESALNDEGDFSVIPEHLDNLIHELHYCLHRVRFNESNNRSGHFQIEWFTNNFVELDSDFTFSNTVNFGDLILQNPFVGHNPLKCYYDNDYENITRTCRIPNRIKSGIVLVSTESIPCPNFDDYFNWWHTKGKDFVDAVGYDTIVKYTGEGKIGEVTNKDLFASIISCPDILTFEKLEF